MCASIMASNDDLRGAVSLIQAKMTNVRKYTQTATKRITPMGIINSRANPHQTNGTGKATTRHQTNT